MDRQIDAVTHCSQFLYRLGFTNEPCGERDIAPKEKWLEILDFTHFSRKMLFSQSERKEKKKAILSGIPVSVVLDLECATPKNDASKIY